MLKGFIAIINHEKKVTAKSISKLFLIEGTCFMSFFLKANISKAVPNTKERLATLEPMTLPIIIDPLSSSAAKKVVSISGAEVPKAITVEPIRKGDIPKLVAAETEYFSSFSALIQIKVIPKSIGKKAVIIIKRTRINFNY